MNRSREVLYKLEVMGDLTRPESTFSFNLFSMKAPVKGDHEISIKCSVCCKNIYLKLKPPSTGSHNDTAIFCTLFGDCHGIKSIGHLLLRLLFAKINISDTLYGCVMDEGWI